MKKVLFLFMLITTFVFSNVDYSEMSTQELIAIMGYVEKENLKDFNKELTSRLPTMSDKEKLQYKKNLRMIELEKEIEGFN